MADHFPATARGWFKSHKSNCTGACVEVCFDPTSVHIRDSKSVGGATSTWGVPMITVSLATWDRLNRSLAVADLGVVDTLVAESSDHGGVELRCLVTGTVLEFTVEEWRAFLDGVRAGEFQRTPVSA